MIEGIRQRLMAYLYLRTMTKQARPGAKKNFFYHFEDYANLAMWKVHKKATLACFRCHRRIPYCS